MNFQRGGGRGFVGGRFGRNNGGSSGGKMYASIPIGLITQLRHVSINMDFHIVISGTQSLTSPLHMVTSPQIHHKKVSFLRLPKIDQSGFSFTRRDQYEKLISLVQQSKSANAHSLNHAQSCQVNAYNSIISSPYWILDTEATDQMSH